MTRQAITERMKIQCLLHRGEIECTECGLVIDPWNEIEFDHIHAVVAKGPHEYENLRPIHYDCHKEKTKRDIALNAKAKRIEKKRLGTAKPKRGPKMKSRSFDRRYRKRMSGQVEKRT